jgi:hypothetical protein
MRRNQQPNTANYSPLARALLTMGIVVPASGQRNPALSTARTIARTALATKPVSRPTPRIVQSLAPQGNNGLEPAPVVQQTPAMPPQPQSRALLTLGIAAPVWLHSKLETCTGCTLARIALVTQLVSPTTQHTLETFVLGNGLVAKVTTFAPDVRPKAARRIVGVGRRMTITATKAVAVVLTGPMRTTAQARRSTHSTVAASFSNRPPAHVAWRRQQ